MEENDMFYIISVFYLVWIYSVIDYFEIFNSEW